MAAMLLGILGCLCFGSGDWLMMHGNPAYSGEGDAVFQKDGESYRLRNTRKVKHDNYFIPLLIRPKGNTSSMAELPLKELFDAVDEWPNCLGYVIATRDGKIELSKKAIDAMRQHKPKHQIEIFKGDVLDVCADAIVNAANKTLLGGGGVDGAIHRAAGPMLDYECMALGGCEAGEAKISYAWGMEHADHIIHTFLPVYAGKKEDALNLFSCYMGSLDLALENGCMSIAFPCISTGAYGFPLDLASAISVDAVGTWLDSHPDVPMGVCFCCFRDEGFTAYRKIFKF